MKNYPAYLHGFVCNRLNAFKSVWNPRFLLAVYRSQSCFRVAYCHCKTVFFQQTDPEGIKVRVNNIYKPFQYMTDFSTGRRTETHNIIIHETRARAWINTQLRESSAGVSWMSEINHDIYSDFCLYYYYVLIPAADHIPLDSNSLTSVHCEWSEIWFLLLYSLDESV